MPNTLRLLFLLALWPLTASAYIDPGSGMLLWQGAIALIGASVVFVRHPIKMIKGWFEGLFRKDRG